MNLGVNPWTDRLAVVVAALMLSVTVGVALVGLAWVAWLVAEVVRRGGHP